MHRGAGRPRRRSRSGRRTWGGKITARTGRDTHREDEAPHRGRDTAQPGEPLHDDRRLAEQPPDPDAHDLRRVGHGRIEGRVRKGCEHAGRAGGPPCELLRKQLGIPGLTPPREERPHRIDDRHRQGAAQLPVFVRRQCRQFRQLVGPHAVAVFIRALKRGGHQGDRHQEEAQHAGERCGLRKLADQPGAAVQEQSVLHGRLSPVVGYGRSLRHARWIARAACLPVAVTVYGRHTHSQRQTARRP